MFSYITIISTFFWMPIQQQYFPIDEYGKYTIMKVVEMPGYARELLYQNGGAWANDQFKKPAFRKDSVAWSISTLGKITVHNVGSLKKHPDGVVEFTLEIEIKEGRYRYTLTNYTFIPYIRNRYARFEPERNKSVPLESANPGINKANWNNYIKTAYSRSQSIIAEMSEGFLNPVSDKPKNVKRDDSW